MDKAAQEKFFAQWRREARPQVEAYVAELLPNLELNGRPATRFEAVAFLKHVVSENAKRFIRNSVPEGTRLTEQEEADVLRITLEVLDEIGGKGH